MIYEIVRQVVRDEIIYIRADDEKSALEAAECVDFEDAGGIRCEGECISKVWTNSVAESAAELDYSEPNTAFDLNLGHPIKL